VKPEIPVLSHPPYSPDLALSFISKIKKNMMKGTRFEAVSLIQPIVKRELMVIWEVAFSQESV
jgi:hypothetical protein